MPWKQDAFDLQEAGTWTKYFWISRILVGSEFSGATWWENAVQDMEQVFN